QLRGLRRAAPLQQRSRRRPHVLPTLPRRICERRRKRDQHHPQAALPLLIRSTIWAADLAPSGPPPLFPVEEVDRSRTHVIAAATGACGSAASPSRPRRRSAHSASNPPCGSTASPWSACT